MKRWIAGGLALGLAGVGGGLLASPGIAQEDDGGFDFITRLNASLSPTVVQGGGTITASSTDPCPQPPEVEQDVVEVSWAYGPRDWFNIEEFTDVGEVVDVGTAPVNDDGSWEFSFNATQTSGAYQLVVVCIPEPVAETMPEDPGAALEELEDLANQAAENAAAAAEDAADIQGFAGRTGGDDHDGDHGGSTSTVPEETTTTTAPTSSTTPSTVPEVEEGYYVYGPLDFTVQGAPAPATPVQRRPNFTG